jgi:hypothetical protein
VGEGGGEKGRKFNNDYVNGSDIRDESEEMQ